MTVFDHDESERSDRSLLRRFRGGEPDAATALYLRYADRLQALARSQTSGQLSSRFDPEDVVQSVFRTFFRRASEGLYEVPPGEQLWQLLLVLALNKVRTLAVHHRAKKRDVFRTVGSPALDRYQGVQDESPMQILSMIIDEVVGRLPDIQQQMIKLRIEGNEVQQIADQTTRSKRSVERVLQKVRQQLAQLIDDDATEVEARDE
ncbi:MAG: sigma-70 family RNA polymerase sigma factor [Planctomycetaceae bacterium]|nr:sigma-70 family RNA polymerase sigma factor [Planctomycetaceae bacterium]